MVREIETKYGREISPSFVVDNSDKVFRWLAENTDLCVSTVEKFISLYLNNMLEVVGYKEISSGTQTESLVHPVEVFHAGVVFKAAGCIVAHNHPAGGLNPSSQDMYATRRLIEAGELLGVPVKDHVIVAGDNYLSFRKEGLM